jgi:hypothetical protein
LPGWTTPLTNCRTGRPHPERTERRMDTAEPRSSGNCPGTCAQNLNLRPAPDTTEQPMSAPPQPYVRADLDEIAAALAALTGEPHPLAQRAEYERTHPLCERSFGK